jgi:predicted branched-subunit amino acid permease
MSSMAAPPESDDDHGWLQTGAILAGARAVLPLSVGIFPFGLAYGVAVVASSIDDLAGALASVLVLAGAAQLAMVDLIDDGAPWFVIIGTALVINARFMMYSGSLAPTFKDFPRRWRIPLAHLMTDQAAVTALLYSEKEPDAHKRMGFWIGAGGSFALSWFIGTFLGVLVGTAVPAELQIGFAVPLMFISLAVPTVRDRPSAVAAAVGFSVTLLAREAPLNTGLLIGAAAGIAFGMLAKVRWGGSSSDAATVAPLADADRDTERRP